MFFSSWAFFLSQFKKGRVLSLKHPLDLDTKMKKKEKEIHHPKVRWSNYFIESMSCLLNKIFPECTAKINPSWK